MKHLTRLCLSLSLVLGAASASAGPASPPAHDPGASSEKASSVTVKHQSRDQGVRAVQRGEDGLAPTAGISTSVSLQLESSRSASMQNFLGASVGRSAEIGPNKKESRAARRKKADEPAPKFVPDALDFLD